MPGNAADIGARLCVPQHRERIFRFVAIVVPAEYFRFGCAFAHSGPSTLMKAACSVADIIMLGSFFGLCGSFWGVTAPT